MNRGVTWARRSILHHVAHDCGPVARLGARGGAGANIPGIRVGTLARLDFPASGRQPFAARVDFVYPTLTDRTRTLRVRFSAANPGGSLRPGLYGTAAFESAGQVVITVPRDAVVDTGLQQHVFVATGDRFEPRAVTPGGGSRGSPQRPEEGERIVARRVPARLREPAAGDRRRRRTQPRRAEAARHARRQPAAIRMRGTTRHRASAATRTPAIKE